ncbi:ammonium transporter [Brevibacterium sp. BRM-1]|uniref:ammonium transporter n=1 Tax=Brevibacterium sp. BRM-1 TaxID=2999062 RepID=UPI002282A827|nr:ammonium transporter [Brevibacterium sp. BRM-1]WAL41295.1 ammonium transporter [Brevibacterium sp. BRM-1]
MQPDDVWTLVSGVWMMIAAALVLFMTPGVAFFYGGMTRAKSTLNMMMMSFSAIAVVGVVWVLWGYSMAAGSEGVAGLFANPFEYFGMSQLLGSSDLIAAGFSGTFAIITVALISGGIADRTKFSAWLVFCAVWATLVYCPLAYMVWGGGLLSEDGWFGQTFGAPIDFAGGTVVHINAGVAALVLALILGKRTGFGKDPAQRPHSIPFVMLGAAILWFGWFGFNVGAGSSLEEIGLIFINTVAAPGAALIGWLAVEWLRDGKPTSLGGASGIVAGLVAITPACANVTPLGALAIGLLAGIASAFAVGLKFRLGYDDSLDVVGVHLVSGIVGTVLIGFFAAPVSEDAALGLLYGGDGSQLLAQVMAALFSIVFTGVMTLIIGLAIHKTMGMRVTREAEDEGVDITEHAETGYEFGGLGVGGAFSPHHPGGGSASERIAAASAADPAAHRGQPAADAGSESHVGEPGSTRRGTVDSDREVETIGS